MNKRTDPRIVRAGMRGVINTIEQDVVKFVLEDVGTRTGILLDKYHALHVAPIAIKLDWLEKVVRWYARPWFVRFVLWAVGRAPDLTPPDIDAAVQAKMEEINSRFVPNCLAMQGEERCELPMGHEGPHQRSSRLSDEPVTWEDTSWDPIGDDGSEVATEISDEG